MKVMKFSEFSSHYLSEKYSKSEADKITGANMKLELAKIDADKALEVAKKALDDKFEDIYGSDEEFKKHFEAAKESAIKNGKYKRGEMPVINNSNFKGNKEGKEDEESAPRTEIMDDALEDAGVDNEENRAKVMANQVLTLKFLLKEGLLDVIGKDKDLANKVQNDLYKDEDLAKSWLTAGKGDKKEQVKGDVREIPVKELKPIQQQIFFTKSMKMSVPKSGEPSKDAMEWLLKPSNKSPLTIVSNDGYILDGHHRWLGAYLVDPDTKMKCCLLDMDKDKLLELTNKFTGAIGNKPNVTA